MIIIRKMKRNKFIFLLDNLKYFFDLIFKQIKSINFYLIKYNIYYLKNK